MKNIYYRILAISILFLSLNFNANAQNWNIPSATTTATTHFGTTNGYDLPFYAGGIEKMRIFNTHTGGVLIGTTAPSRLDTKLSIVSTPFQVFTTQYSPQSEMIAHFKSSALSGVYKNAEIMSFYNNGGGHFLKFQKVNSSSVATELFTVDVDGKTYIGNANSTGTLLTVNGGTIIGNTTSTGTMLSVTGRTVIGDATVSTPAGYNLYVTSGILTEKLKVAVKTTTNWSDFVFNQSYKLMPLKEVEKFIDTNKHLPDVPSAEEMVQNGLDVATMDAKLLQKIEELTLYMIEMQKANDLLIKRIETLEIKK